MKTLNFKDFGIYTSIDALEPFVQDVRREIADAMYQSLTGIEAHDLAFRIFRSEGAIELSESDEAVITDFFQTRTKVWMYESFIRNIKE